MGIPPSATNTHTMQSLLFLSLLPMALASPYGGLPDPLIPTGLATDTGKWGVERVNPNTPVVAKVHPVVHPVHYVHPIHHIGKRQAEEAAEEAPAEEASTKEAPAVKPFVYFGKTPIVHHPIVHPIVHPVVHHGLLGLHRPLVYHG